MPESAPVTAIPQPLAERTSLDRESFLSEVEPRYEPLVLRRLAADWPAVRAARASDASLVDYLRGLDSGTPVEAFVGPASMQGRYFYTEDMRGFNFERRRGGLSEALAALLRVADEAEPPCFYIGAAPIPEVMPGFSVENPMVLFAAGSATPRAWIGNRSTVTSHFDLSDNIACVVAGRRRFTLFPPDQIANLYVGPLDHTMAGQPASLVDLHDPDLERFPRFREAMESAKSAILEPGDAIYVPSLWWHHVESLEPVNMLVNYWENPPVDAGSPFEAMIHALMAIAALPAPRRTAWRSFFDHYVFRPERDPAEHLPPEHRGILGEQNADLRDRMRQFVMRGLGRR